MIYRTCRVLIRGDDELRYGVSEVSELDARGLDTHSKRRRVGDASMFFAQAALQNLQNDLATMPMRRDAVLYGLLSRTYQVPGAWEFAPHGIWRRLKTVTHCIDGPHY